VPGTAEDQRGAALLEGGETQVTKWAIHSQKSSELRVRAHQTRGFHHSAQTERGGANAGELAPDGVRPPGEEPCGERGKPPAHRLGPGGGGGALGEGELGQGDAREPAGGCAV